MSSKRYPARGFFVGKGGLPLLILRITLVAALIGLPTTIQADTIPHPESTTAEAPTALTALAIPQPAPQNTKTVWVTAYTSAPDETSEHPLITASGGMVHDGVVAANFLPFGTRIEIPSLFGDKVFTVEDRTSEAYGGRVDIWMPTVNAALDFGIEHAKIVILDPDLALQ